MGARTSGRPGRITTGCCALAALAAQTLGDGPPATMTFQDQSERIDVTVVEQGGNWKVVHAGDFDLDDDLDVVIAVAQQSDTVVRPRRNKLYRNDEGVLNEVSGSPTIPGFDFTDTTRAVLFRDFDNDGWLDIIVINDSNSGAANENAPGKTKYFRNDHPNGVFSSFVNESFRLNGAAAAALSARN